MDLEKQFSHSARCQAEDLNLDTASNDVGRSNMPPRASCLMFAASSGAAKAKMAS